MKNSIPSKVVLWGFRHFVSYLWCFLPTKYLFCIYFLCISPPLDVRVLIGRHQWKQQRQRAWSMLTASLFWLPRYLYCLFINSSTLLSDLQSRLNGSYPIGRGLLRSALLSPVHSEILPKMNILHSIHIVYVLFWHE